MSPLLNAQGFNSFECYFDNSCADQSQDTLSNPNNIWEVGIPNKTVFDAAYVGTNSMITDLDSAYSVNDTSYFILGYEVGEGYILELHGAYWVNSDTLNDFGTIEVSLNQGNSWIDMLNDTIYLSGKEWDGPKPVLTGNSDGWKEFQFISITLHDYFNFNYGDTVMYRFGFISDGQSDTLDGLMFDAIEMFDWMLSVPQYSMGDFESKVYPNPTSSSVDISFSNPQAEEVSCVIIDAYGRIVEGPVTTSTESLHFDLQNIERGLYHYRIKKGDAISKGKIVVQ